LNVVGNRGSRHVVVGQQHGNACGGDDFGDGASDAVGQKTRVVANNNATSGVFVLEDIACDCAGNAAHVLESEVVGDKAAPTVGTEFDLCHGSSSLVAGRWSLATPLRIVIPSEARDLH